MKPNWILPGLMLALVLSLWTVLGPIGATPAYAQCGGSSCGGGGGGCSSPCTPTPPCCTPPPPPPAPPRPPCCVPGNNVLVPGVRIYNSPTVVVNSSANATAISNSNAVSGAQGGSQSGAIANSGAFGTVILGGGGGTFGYAGPGALNVISNLNVDMGATSRRVAFQNTRTRTSRIVIRATCMDDKDVPHPASQVIPDKNLDNTYEGEIFRCIAGTTIQYVYGDYAGSDNFNGGTTVVCKKNDAVWFAPGKNGAAGAVSCRPQLAARDCNERSLLRRFGAGVKIVEVTLTETYTDYREEVVQQQASSGYTFTMDGGVGGFTY
jgi:hypothetical protein